MADHVDIMAQPGPGAQRDAIHVAVIPLIAGEHLYKSSSFKLAFGTQDIALRAYYDDVPLGIINPFVETSYKKGQPCWGFLLPGTVTGMRHHWQHPAFDAAPLQISDDERWMREFAQRWNFDYDLLLASASSDDADAYVVARGIDLHSAEELGEDQVTFWEVLERLTGKFVHPVNRMNFGWSCSC